MQKVKINSFYSKDLDSNILEVIFSQTGKILYLKNDYNIPFKKNKILSFDAFYDIKQNKFQDIKNNKNCLSKESVQKALKEMEDLF